MCIKAKESTGIIGAIIGVVAMGSAAGLLTLGGVYAATNVSPLAIGFFSSGSAVLVPGVVGCVVSYRVGYLQGLVEKIKTKTASDLKNSNPDL